MDEYMAAVDAELALLTDGRVTHHSQLIGYDYAAAHAKGVEAGETAIDALMNDELWSIVL